MLVDNKGSSLNESSVADSLISLSFELLPHCFRSAEGVRRRGRKTGSETKMSEVGKEWDTTGDSTKNTRPAGKHTNQEKYQPE